MPVGQSVNRTRTGAGNHYIWMFPVIRFRQRHHQLDATVIRSRMNDGWSRPGSRA